MSIDYELLKLKASRQGSSPKKGQEAPEPQAPKPASSSKTEEEPETGDDLMPWQREASERAVEQYSKAQEKKWRRWNQRMFGKAG